ncbi:MAG: aminopeptidase P family protein [Melioribacteraceae bacterium]|jgi:Xaa-Pro dipeptidase|nr:aminopeptidase P family protein [Melioribacteraceae bacterium]
MFSSETYINRRNELKKILKSGILFFPGSVDTPMNYRANTYKFRQDSTFLYYFGIDAPDLAAVIDVDNNREIIFGNDRDIDDIVWMGQEKSISEKASEVGVTETKSMSELANSLASHIDAGEIVHHLPQHQAQIMIEFDKLLKIHPSEVNDKSSKDFIRAVVKQRSIKSDKEVAEIEKALDISYLMNTLAMRASSAGTLEREVFGAVEGLALGMGNGISFPVIFSVNGETLHNHHHENIMKDGDLALLDSGAESLLHYASDITRTFPVSGKFTQRQKDIYNIVLDSQLKAIELIKPGVNYKEIHLETAKVIASGLKELGLMKGNIDEAVSQGAHALFYPHGLGHMLGLDVHDMEGLGEGFVGYDENTQRSEQFGLAYLRLAKELHPGFVITVEPGIYFIPQLYKNWKAENKLAEFINYDEVAEYMDFGGIRIEDDILVTETGNRVLGKSPIPKTVEEVERACG